MSRTAFAIGGFDGWPYPFAPATFPIDGAFPISDEEMDLLHARFRSLQVSGTLTRAAIIDGSTVVSGYSVGQAMGFTKLTEVDRVDLDGGSFVTEADNPDDVSSSVVPYISVPIYTDGVLTGFNLAFSFEGLLSRSGTQLRYPAVAAIPGVDSVSASAATITVLGHVLPLQLYKPVPGASFDTFTGNLDVNVLQYLEYRKADGTAPIYDINTGEQLIFPLPTSYSF